MARVEVRNVEPVVVEKEVVVYLTPRESDALERYLSNEDAPHILDDLFFALPTPDDE